MKSGQQKSGSLVIFIVLSGLVWIYIMLRAWKVQFSTDEAATFFMYVQTGRFLPPGATIDANNHLLNSFLTWLCYQMMGSHPFVLRLPNVLSAVLYFYFIYRISQLLISKPAKWVFIALSLLTHFLIEFFSLSRGYGLSLAFLAGAVYYLLLSGRQTRLSVVTKLLLFLILAILANLNLIFIGLTMVLILLLMILFNRESRSGRNRISAIVLIIMVAVPAFIFFLYQSFQIKSSSGFYYGSADGFFPVTVQSLSAMIAGKKMIVFAYYAVFLVIIMTTLLSIEWIRKKSPGRNLPALIFLTLLLSNCIGSVAIHYLLDVNFQEDRAAIHLLPLLYGFIAFGIDQGSKKHITYRYILLSPLVLILFYSFIQVSMHKTVYGPGQQFPQSFYQYIENRIKDNEFPPVISSHQVRRQSWAFMNYRQGGSLNPVFVSGHPWINADYIIEQDSLPTDFERLFTAVLKDNKSGAVLYERNDRVVKSEILSLKYEQASQSHEMFKEILQLNIDSLRGRSLFLTVDMQVESPAVPFEAVIVAEVFDENRKNLGYEAIDLDQLRPEWHDEVSRVHHVITISDIPENARSLLFYIWNKREREFTIRDGMVTLSTTLN